MVSMDGRGPQQRFFKDTGPAGRRDLLNYDRKTNLKMPRTASAKQVAKIIGVSVQRISQLEQEGILTRNDRGRFDLAESTKAYRDQIAPRPSSGSYVSRLRRYQSAKADLLELQLRVKKGELVQAVDCVDVFGSHLGMVKQRLTTQPSRLGPRLVGKSESEIANLLRKDAVGTLQMLSGEVQEGLKDELIRRSTPRRSRSHLRMRYRQSDTLIAAE
jgi:phage terminase Nu1 subunit (DNA packaging protein)